MNMKNRATWHRSLTLVVWFFLVLSTSLITGCETLKQDEAGGLKPTLYGHILQWTSGWHTPEQPDE